MGVRWQFLHGENKMCVTVTLLQPPFFCLAAGVIDLRKHGRVRPSTQKIFRGDILKALDSRVKKQYRPIAKEYLWKIINKTGILKPSGDNWVVLSDTSMELARDNTARLGSI